VGQTLILYNDAPTGFPAPDPRYDYCTNDTKDNTGTNLIDIGGAPPTQKGYGPNTRTIMQIKVLNSPPSAPYNLTALNETFAKTATKRGVFEASQDPIIVPMPGYESAYNSSSPFSNQAVGSNEDPVTFTTLFGKTVTIPQQKAIQGMMPYACDLDYGRMIGLLGLELPAIQAYKNYALYSYTSPPVEIPNVVRDINPSMPEGVVLQGPPGGYKDPQGNPVTLYNHKTNYGWGYVYHCHVLGHEENDMMHAVIFAVAPKPPTHLVATRGNGVDLSWKSNSIAEIGFTIQRVDDPQFTVGLTTFKVGPEETTYVDKTSEKNKRYFYRIQANNLVGNHLLAGVQSTSAD